MGARMSAFDKSHIYDMLADEQGKEWHSFTANLLRLMTKADKENFAKLASAFPEEAQAYQDWYAGKVSTKER